MIFTWYNTIVVMLMVVTIIDIQVDALVHVMIVEKVLPFVIIVGEMLEYCVINYEFKNKKMETNKIIKPKTLPVTDSQRESMNIITNKIIQLIKDKHL
jgi:hypothetical protein